MLDLLHTFHLQRLRRLDVTLFVLQTSRQVSHLSEIAQLVTSRAQVCLAPKPCIQEELWGSSWAVSSKHTERPRLFRHVALPCPLALESSTELYMQLAETGRKRVT